MNKKQYNNVIDWTIKHEPAAQTEDSLATARAVFNNMGVALPNGTMEEVYETIKTDKYMGWKSCTMQEAQAAADKGTAAIGISKDRIVVLSATDEEQPVAQTASVMTLSETTSAYAVDGLQYYSYSDGPTAHHNIKYIYLSYENDDVIVVKWSGYLNLNVYPESAQKPTVVWTSSNTDVATVDFTTGLITAKSVGTTVITAKTRDMNFEASYTLQVRPLYKRVCDEKLFVGTAVNDIIGIQAYRVNIEFACVIDAVDEDRVRVQSVETFASYDKGALLEGISYPELSIGTTTLNGEQLKLQNNDSPVLVSPYMRWTAAKADVNEWFLEGTEATSMAVLWMDGALGFPYRELRVSITL